MKEISTGRIRLALLADAGHVNIQRWCEGLSEAGGDIHVLSFNDGPPGIGHVHQLGPSKIPGKSRYIASVPRVRRILDEIDPHVVVAYYVTGYGLLGALAGYHPLVQVTSGSDVLLAPRNPFMKWLLRFNLSKADLVTAWAPHMARAAQDLGVPDDRILVLPRGIPSHRFSSARRAASTATDPIKIICTRSLKEGYRLDLLCHAMSILQDGGVNFKLTIAGDGPLRSELMSLVTSLRLNERVCFAGFVLNDDLPELLAQHDIYVSLVDSDGVSASLLEVMAVGLTPILPDNPANRFWITSGENGALLSDLEPRTVARAILDVCANPQLRRCAWEQNSGRVARDGDLYRNSAKYIEHFRRLTSQELPDRQHSGAETPRDPVFSNQSSRYVQTDQL